MTAQIETLSLLNWLKRYPNSEAKDLESLKKYQVEVTHISREEDKFSPDIRYYLNEEGQIVGLHLSHLELDQAETFWQLFNKEKVALSQTLEVLYLTDVIGDFTLEGFSELTFLQFSQCKFLRKLFVRNTPKLIEFHAALCPALEEVRLERNFPTLKTLDLSKGKLSRVEFPKLPSLRYLILFDNQLSTISLVSLPKIEYIFLQKNPLKKIEWPEEQEELFTDLEVIELPDNTIRASSSDCISSGNAVQRSPSVENKIFLSHFILILAPFLFTKDVLVCSKL